jgi:DNA modification methylase
MTAADFAPPVLEREPVVPVFRDSLVTVYQADCLDLLPTMPADSVAAVITDPPYGLEFMGRAWDRPWKTVDGFRRGYRSWCVEWARECLRVLKPGGYLLAFGSTRTWHRLAMALEDAGFEIRDTIAWLYGQGFPKSLDVSKALDHAAGADRPEISRGRPLKRMIPGAGQNRAGSWRKENGRFFPAETLAAAEAARQWQGWGTGLKPAFEPIIVARKPLIGKVAANVAKHGVGGLHINVCRVPINDADRVTINRKHAGMSVGTYRRAPGSSLNLSVKPLSLKPAHAHDLGRWPANAVLVHAPACDEDHCVPDCPVAELDRQSGKSVSRVSLPRRSSAGVGWGMTASGSQHDDAGGASRFFPAFRWQAKAPSRERPHVGEVAHPTVKPLELMRWLVRLVAPPGGLVLDPFLGSGTTAEAARAEGFQCIGIEREAEYVPLIRARLSKRADASRPVGTANQPSSAGNGSDRAERDLAAPTDYRGPP